MARIRTIKPEMWADEKLARLSRDARLLFLALISNADDSGRMRGSVLFVRAACFPYDADLDVDALLVLLSEGGFIHRYEAEGQSFLLVKNFTRHQKIDRPSPSTIPAPAGSPRVRRKLVEASPNPRTKPQRVEPEPVRAIDEASLLDLGSGSGSRKGEEGNGVATAIALAPGTSTPVFEAYGEAYHGRYGTPPVRNAKVSKQLVEFVKRIGADEAPDIAAFYVKHNRALYVSSGHCVDLLLRDAEKLRTEWVTGKQITGTEARLTDRTQTNAEGWSRLLKEKPNAVG